MSKADDEAGAPPGDPAASAGDRDALVRDLAAVPVQLAQAARGASEPPALEHDREHLAGLASAAG